jgi:hypothetical protein
VPYVAIMEAAGGGKPDIFPSLEFLSPTYYVYVYIYV